MDLESKTADSAINRMIQVRDKQAALLDEKRKEGSPGLEVLEADVKALEALVREIVTSKGDDLSGGVDVPKSDHETVSTVDSAWAREKWDTLGTGAKVIGGLAIAGTVATGLHVTDHLGGRKRRTRSKRRRSRGRRSRKRRTKRRSKRTNSRKRSRKSRRC